MPSSSLMSRGANTSRVNYKIACLLLALICLDDTTPTAAQSPTHAGPEPITPIPAMPAQNPRRVALGERLFSDRRLSHDNSRSCSSCHDIRTNGASANAHDVTPQGQPLALNTPTVFNASLNFRLNWDGKFRSLEDETSQTLRNPAIMASSAEEAVSKLRNDPGVLRQFRNAYGRDPDAAALVDAIATFERSLVTPGSRFDEWLAGDAGAITPAELAGYQCSNRLAASPVTKASTWVATYFSVTASFIHSVRPSRSWCAFLACATWRPRHPISTMAARPRCRRRSRPWALRSLTAR